MNTQDILSAIDAEIARLQSARSLLAGTASQNVEDGHARPDLLPPQEENHVSRRKEEDRRGTAQALGEAEGGEEVGNFRICRHDLEKGRTLDVPLGIEPLLLIAVTVR